MSIGGLDKFVKILDERGVLIRIKEYVDPVYEIAEITDRFSKLEGGAKALLFENTGTTFPVLTNIFGADERVDLSLGIKTQEELFKIIDNFFKTIFLPKTSFLNIIGALSTFYKLYQWTPVSISGKGECQQVVQLDPDLNILPTLKYWAYDGGKSLTLSTVNSVDPETNNRVVGIHRMQVFAKNIMGMHWSIHEPSAKSFDVYRKRGEQMPIAVTLGGDPTYVYAANAKLPDYIDNYLLAGFLRKRKVKLVKGITVDIEVPSDVDIVIEGYVDTQEEMIWEGPLGDRTGFYSLANWQPKFYVTCITHKKNAIFPATIPGVSPMEDRYLNMVSEQLSLGYIKFFLFPEIVDMFSPKEGAGNNISIIKVNNSSPGIAHKVANTIWGSSQMMFNKILIVVNSDIDIHNTKVLAQLVSKQYNPLIDTFFSKGPQDILNHASAKQSVGGKMLIDATERSSGEIYDEYKAIWPDVETMAERLGDKDLLIFDFSAKLLMQGVSVLLVSIDKGIGISAKSVANSLVRKLKGVVPKFIVFVDKELKLQDLSLVAWYVLGNCDPTRDCFFVDNEGKPLPCLMVDGTRKSFPEDAHPREWANVVCSSPEVIARVDSKWDSLGIGPLIESPSRRLLEIQFGDSAMVK